MLLKLIYSNCVVAEQVFPKLVESRWKKKNSLSSNKRNDVPTKYRLFGFNLRHLGKYSNPLSI